jgi:hypothetical protein
MITETIEDKGYKIQIAQDEGAENPFEAWDCEPPLFTFYGGRHGSAKAYNEAPENWRDILYTLPDKTWERGERMNFIREFIAPNPSRSFLRDIVERIDYLGNIFEVAIEILNDEKGAKPEGWGAACEWFELAENLLKYAGIPCLYEQSNGHSQGDSTLCLVVLTPEWYEKTGAPKENAEKDCKSAIELYSAWAWGDVYGVSEIIAPGPLDEDGDETEGEEIEDASCWGFYGSNHEKSGLMEHARDSIECHIKKQAEEAEELTAALCSAE